MMMIQIKIKLKKLINKYDIFIKCNVDVVEILHIEKKENN